MAALAFTERRAFFRQALSLPVLVKRVPETRNGSSLQGMTRDISNRGAYFWVAGTFQVGDRLHLIFELPPRHGRNYAVKIEREAEVIRVDTASSGGQKTGVAVRILHLEVTER